MPNPCFSYPAAVPPEIPRISEAHMPFSCFSYPPGGPASIPDRDSVWASPDSLRQMPASSTCFRYQAELPLTMPAMCFSYQPRTGHRGPVPSAPPGLRQMPGTTTCFRY